MYSIFEKKRILGVLVVIALSGRTTERVFLVMGFFISIIVLRVFWGGQVWFFVCEYSVVCHGVKIGIVPSLIWPGFHIKGFVSLLFY